MASERKGIERRMRELKNDLSAKQKMYKNAELILLDEDADDFIIDNLEDLISKEKTVAEIIEHDAYNHRSIEELKPYLEELEQIICEVEEMISGYYREDIPNDFKEFLEESGVKVSLAPKIGLYESVYYFLKRSLPERPVNPLMASISFPDDAFLIRPDLLSSAGPDSIQAYREKRKNRDMLRDEVTILSLQLEEQQKILEDYAKPSGFYGGLLVLFYASIVGVAYPTTLLPYPSNYYDDVATKWLLITLFISQLVALFVYLTIEIYKMKKQRRYLEQHWKSII
ncbi:hypothetical protein BTO30_15925 [Domibacillus antri]|uniref:Uncharacterized protein n=1 Tax=Domibacillus antri TaxID=1714264 RepID=A0A1Q8Q1R6_9BACI|nr:hypothetical protein [Domibacillus antri]OLN21270.1 hypothetical protein BTO30_15925 [Domibacillus antri]